MAREVGRGDVCDCFCVDTDDLQLGEGEGQSMAVVCKQCRWGRKYSLSCGQAPLEMVLLWVPSLQCNGVVLRGRSEDAVRAELEIL